MEPEKILHELTYTVGLPREALKAASAQRVEMLPLFLDEIETYLALGPAARTKPTPLFFIFHLLGEWREKAAYYRLPVIPRCGRVIMEAYHVWGMDDGSTLFSQRTGGGRAAALGAPRERACVPAGSDDREHAGGDGA
jgi:hypothetical protein